MRWIKFLIISLFFVINLYSQVVTNTATLYSNVTQADNSIITVPIPITIVRTNGRIAELSLNISNVSQNAQKINLRVYELIYTTNVVETPLTNSTTSGTTGGTIGGSTGGGTGGTTGGTGSTDSGTTSGGTGGTTGGTTGGSTGGTTGGGTTSTNYVYVTNSVTLNVTLQTQTGTTNDVQIPAQTIWHNDKLENILFDITTLPADAIILRFRILDYIYDENGNLVGPQGSGTNSGGTGTGGSGTGTGTGGSGTGTGGGTISPPPPSSDSVQFPIEVLGADQHIEQFKLVLNDDVGKLYGLKLKVHGLTYTNKMSISINDSPWISLNNTNVDIPSKWDRAMYGMAKNHGTITFVVPFAPNNIAKSSVNNIKVKFNDIDKETVGYRILDADLVKSEPNGYEVKAFYKQFYQAPNHGLNTNWINKYTPLTLATVKIQDDPSKWLPISTDLAVINKGKDIWFNGNITERGLPIKAKCTDCHTTDGFDLKYFNYSDKSIIARSKYHGLNDDDSEAIAVYIRSLNAPYQEKGRPWNPPYQPGPGLDSKPISSWAAGAGLEAVAEDDLDTLKVLFPNGFKNGIKYDDGVAPIDFKKSLNLREIPLVIQLPDWNRWLPRVHLKDVAPELWDYFEKTNSYKVFDWQRNVAMSSPTSDPAKFLLNNYRGFSERYAYARIQADQGGVYNLYIENTTNTWQNIKIRNLINPSYNHSIIVKHWEILNKFGLQDLGHAVFDPNLKDPWGNQGHYIMENKPESFFISKGIDYKKVIQKRRWFDTYTFHLAPHIAGETSSSTTEWGPQSFQWYQVQMILDDTNRNPDRNTVDWGYLLAFQNATQDHGNGDYHLYTTRSHSIVLMNMIKTAEAYEFQIGNPLNTGAYEGRYIAPRPQSWQFISSGIPWQRGFQFNTDWVGWFIKYMPGFGNNSIYFSAVRDVSSAWFDAEISKFHEIDPQYLKDTGLNEEYLNLAEAGLRYIGGDVNVINKIVTLRNKVWPDNTYLNKIDKNYPEPYPQWK
jgi:hypothetical protein